MEAWTQRRPTPTREERERVAAAAREVIARQQQVERQRSDDPDAVARAMVNNEALRARSGITSRQLEEALTNLRRLQGGRE